MVAGLILGLRPANERWCYFVTTSLIGWAQAYNQPCGSIVGSIWVKCQNQGSVLLTGPWLTWFQQAYLSTGPWLTQFQQACLSSTQVCSVRFQASEKVSTCPPQVLDICPPGLVMGANWVIHYKVVLSADGGNSLVLACEWSEILGYFLGGGKILSC